jgi:hypothetical protein
MSASSASSVSARSFPAASKRPHGGSVPNQPKTFRSACSEYLRLHSQAAEIRTRMDALRDIIVPGLREGQTSPPTLPYVLKLRISKRTVADYKAPFLETLSSLLGSEAAAEAEVERIESEFETRDVESLVVEINRAFGV